MSFPSNKGLAQIEEEFAIEEADELSNLLSLSLPMIFETLDNRWKGLTGWKSDEGSEEGGEKKGEGRLEGRREKEIGNERILEEPSLRE